MILAGGEAPPALPGVNPLASVLSKSNILSIWAAKRRLWTSGLVSWLPKRLQRSMFA
jgi:hypothetical protein